ncbi:hypothetical protein EYZ11_007967 [Aspergillus tanneri]|nr:hypothetical protein EYZ11_007967 [Aspergillus tanneri]
MSRQLHLDTSNLGGNPRYSFLETPLEMHAGHQHLHQQPATVPEANAAQHQQLQPATTELAQLPLSEKAQYLPEDPAISHHPSGPNIEHHPAIYAPYADDVPQQIQNHDAVVPDYSYVVPPGSPGPLPIKTNPATMRQIQEIQTVSVVPDANPLQTPQLPRFPQPVAVGLPQTPVMDSLMVYHQPGQIAHPNQVIKGGSWSHRLLATIQRRRTRKAYGIRGDIASDCVRATCCICCTLIQDETEIKTREEERGKAARATGTPLISPYLPPMQMSYGLPR